MTLVSRPSMTDDDGTFTSGTEVDEAFIDDLLDEIDDQNHSSTNPTIKPKATTDEVVAARGSKASLDARLDVALEENGELKSQASLVTGTQFTSALGSRNVALNGDLEDWALGAALAPDDWTLTGVAATIARTGAGEADTFTFGSGTYAAKITRVGNDVDLHQVVVAAADIANYADMRSQKFSVGMNGKTSVASHLRIVVDDGVTQTASSYHTGGGTAEWLSVTHPISASATKLHVIVEVNGSNGDAYCGGFNFVFADSAPSAWQPLSSLPPATATRRGIVSTGAQTWAGVKTLNSPPIGVDGYARVTGNVTKNNSTVFGDVTGALFTVVANGEYEFECVLHVTGTNAASAKFQFTGPASPTGVIYGVSNRASEVKSALALSTAVFYLLEGTAATQIRIKGHLRNGANAGTVQLQFAQWTAEVSDLIVFAESYVIFRRRV
jgi:hypothetical protein